ncbi:MAG TPA: MerR family transcriptional regulator [Woeseiaceae bacterium]|nr:MerR family transcriptional regulator [Woeseiaceae bacterium]
MSAYQIGELSKRIGMSADTLRYYEKIRLLPPVARNTSGVRVYDDQDVSRLNFIRRAQRMNFTLAEIRKLLEMREDPQNVRTDVRALMQKKLLEVEEQLEELNTLRNEMRLLINLCRGAEDGCPIIEDIDHGE